MECCPMKRLLFSLAALGLAIASTPTFAVVTPTPGQILARCPDNPDALDCPAAAEDFLVPRPKSPQSDARPLAPVGRYPPRYRQTADEAV